MEAPLNIYALLASVSRTQLIASWVGNGLLAYVKVSKSHSSNPSTPPLKYSYPSQLCNCLNPTTPKYMVTIKEIDTFNVM